MTMTTTEQDALTVLLVDDDEDEFRLMRDMLGSHRRMTFAVDWRDRYEDALEAIRSDRYDVCLIGDRLGARSGLELVREGFAGRPTRPVILLTGETGDGLDFEARAAGVTDSLVKEDLEPAGLERSIRYAISHHRATSELSRSEERYALAVRAVNDGIWDWDLSAGRIYFSPRWHALLGRPQSASDGDPGDWFSLVHPGDVTRLRAAIDAHLDGHTPHLQSEHRMRHADGGWRWVTTRGLAIRNADGTPSRMAGSLSDVTDRRIAQLRLQHDALHDHLTGLPNRALLMDRISQSLQRAIRDPRDGCAVLLFDVDRFKLVNDSLGHAVGDQLLGALAVRVAASVRPGDTVARLGGDEFTVLLDEIDEPGDATVVAERILRSLNQPFTVAGKELFVSASIGIALSQPRLEPAALIGNADIAMYNAKRRGRGRSAMFDEGMRRRSVDRLVRENELRQVVEASQLGIHYQPIVDLGSGAISGLEALARWPEALGSVPPSEFIAIAEDTGIIGTLGRHVLGAALASLAGWRRDGLIGDEVCMSVNVSARQLDDPGLPAQVRAAIELAQLPPQALKLEITETTLIAELQSTQRVFAEVCSSGVGLHLDDFGTGYSSLSVLHRCPVDALKIDRSFVADLGHDDEGNEVIIRSTVAMAHSLGLAVIAEGIESPAQLRRLRSLGCDFGQGHLFSPALSAPDSRALLKRWKPATIVALLTAA
jgi:diguanylate cyclase (GGDEF)-like protein/PAS domain S-box-containing protein